MPIEHSVITDPEIHEPKGIASAGVGEVYVSNVSGGGNWRGFPHHSFYYDNIGVGFTLTTPATYTLINPTTTADPHPVNFSHNGNGRLTYTGTYDIDAMLNVTLSVKHSTGAATDCYFQIFKNGVAIPGTQTVRTADSANYGSVTIVGHTDLSTNDYIEVYCKAPSGGNIIVHTIAMTIAGIII